MRKIFISLIAFCLLAALHVSAQEPATPVSRPFKVRLPQTTDTANLSILYSLKGSFGGYYSFVRTKTGGRDYEIDTSYQGQPAESLKVIIYNPGYQVETLDFPSLAAVNERSVELHLKPLATIPFSGKVLLPAHLISEEVRVDVSHTPFWKCEFFDLMDCLVSSLKIASVELAEDGRFAVALPDFKHDPTVSSFSRPGDFTFTVSERKSGRFLFNLKPNGSSNSHGQIPIADRYPDEQTFMTVELKEPARKALLHKRSKRADLRVTPSQLRPLSLAAYLKPSSDSWPHTLL